MTESKFPVLALLLSSALACSPTDDPPADGESESESETGSEAALTWWRDVEPIVREKCATCHREGNIAPFSLDSHAAFVTLAPALGPAIEAGAMPPWPPGPDCREYKHDRSLTPEQQTTLLSYLAGEMPEGDVADAQPEGDPSVELVPDVLIEMPEPYVPVGPGDDYRCFLIDWPADLTEDRFITGFEIYPGDRSIVHHVIVYAAEPAGAQAYLDLDANDEGTGYTCFGGPGGPMGSARWIGGWVPGMAPFHAPEGVGQRVGPETVLIMQVHYNSGPDNQKSDRSTIGVELATAVERPAVVVPVSDPAWLASNGSMMIPANEPEVTHAFSLELDHPLLGAMIQNALGPSAAEQIEIWNVGLHMHLFGTRGRLQIRDAGGGNEQCLLDIPAWDFHWQSGYDLVDSVRLRADQELHLQCWWDNSPANQPVIDGEPIEPVDRDWGDGTLDEMCLGIIYATAVP